ncbi:MAG: radical SAM protein [Candidatus Diapherotrites archaeon]
MIYPSELSIELTNICNLKCALCDNPFIERPKGFMDLEKFKKLIDETDSYVKSLNFGVTAEPLLHPKIEEFIAYAKSKGKRTSITSNATLMEGKAASIIKAGLDNAVLSFDGFTRETYEEYRKPAVIGVDNFSLAKKGIETLCAEKKRLEKNNPNIIVSFMVNKYNEHEIGQMKKWSKEIGVNTLLLKAMHFAWVAGDVSGVAKQWESTNKEFVRRFDYTKLGTCSWVNNNSVVYWNGELASCCFDLLGHTKFGNVFEEGFKKIWESEDHKQKQIAMTQRTLKQCIGCSSGVKLGTYINHTPKSLVAGIIDKMGLD